MKEITKKIRSLCKRRGFVFPSSEIYGGFSSSYDFGPLGVQLKRNIKEYWWKEIVQKNKDVVGLDASILMNSDVWKASGHLDSGFADELVECKDCHQRFKEEEVEEECPECGGELTDPQQFNLMMKTLVGPSEEKADTSYLRPETCQGIFVNFKNVLNTTRKKLPFGIAQIGKSFRNEISPGNYFFRTREFEQMEMQWFCSPHHDKKPEDWFDYWKEQRLNWYLDLGIKEDNLRAHEIPEEERAHYAQRQVDIEYKFPFGWGEIEGIHNRGDWDTSTHTKHSEDDLKYYDEERDEKYFPNVIETSVGVERSMLAFLTEAYQEAKGGRADQSNKEEEVVLQLPKRLAPVKVAVFPLVKKEDDLVKKTKEVFDELKQEIHCQYDERGSIGKRYRRADEIGVLYAVTVDFDTLEDDTVTIRDRDSMDQIRVPIEDLKATLKKLIKDEVKFKEAGEEV